MILQQKCYWTGPAERIKEGRWTTQYNSGVGKDSEDGQVEGGRMTP